MHKHTIVEPAVSCREVTKEFGQGEGRVMALRGVDLDIYPGQLTLLVGPSGCGKTTLLSVIAGILDHTAGYVEVLGQDLRRLSNRQKVRFRSDNVGFVFQQYNLLPGLNGAENVAVPCIIAGESRRKAVAKGLAMLETMGMGSRALAMPADLSGGEQQRVAIARALVHEPKLLVCDEPTSALDAHTGHAMMRLIRSMALQPDRAVVVVTHDSRVFEFGDRIAYMDDGRIVRVEKQHVGDVAGHRAVAMLMGDRPVPEEEEELSGAEAA